MMMQLLRQGGGSDIHDPDVRDTPGGADRKPLQGTPDQIVADIRRYRELGVGSFLLEARYRDLDDMVAIFERFAREIRPAVDAGPRRT